MNKEIKCCGLCPSCPCKRDCKPGCPCHQPIEEPEWEKEFENLVKSSDDTYNGGWHEEDTNEAFHHGMMTGFRISKDYIKNLLAEDRQRGIDKIWEMLIESLPSDAENLSTLLPDQALRLLKTFREKLHALEEVEKLLER